MELFLRGVNWSESHELNPERVAIHPLVYGISPYRYCDIREDAPDLPIYSPRRLHIS